MAAAHALFVLRAYSGIHAGVGQELGTVDLPIQRERVTNFPVIRASSLKGAMRQASQDGGAASEEIDLLFGPEGSDHAGAISVGDARLLLFPMRSLKGTFAWLTCPFVLKRLKRDLDDCRLDQQLVLTLPPIFQHSEVLVANESTGVVFRPGGPAQGAGQAQAAQARIVVVEDHGFDVKSDQYVEKLLVPRLAQLHLDPAELNKRLVVVNDDYFQNFTSFCTEVVTRVHLNDATKTVMRGQLWTEELLPAESVLAASVVCSDVRRARPGPNGLQSAESVLERLRGTVTGRFQIGGNETVGYGVCRASWLTIAQGQAGGGGAA